MTTHYLRHFFNPASIAVIGASERPESLGHRVFQNLRTSGFKGQIHAVNPKYRSVCGERSYRKVTEVETPVDLAIIASPERSLADVVRQCGEHGIRAAIVLTGGLGSEAGRQESLDAIRRRYRMRLIGPECLGIMRPSVKLNATGSDLSALPGRIALVAQSGTLCSAILDWAQSRGIGFSTVASLGDAADVEFGDILDFLATDHETQSILLHLEGIREPRRFMSGLRAAARIKPVIVMKTGRHQAAAKLVNARTGAALGADDVFDAALARAGAVRVQSIDQLFAAAAVLSTGRRALGSRLAIVSNGGGPAVIAADRAIDLGLDLAALDEPAYEELTERLPPHHQLGNPIDLRAGIPAQTYAQAIHLCLQDKAVDGVVALYSPQPSVPADQVADAVIEVGKRAAKPLLACWLGEEKALDTRQRFTDLRLAHFETPEAAVEAYSYLAHHQRNQKLLMQVPGAMAFRPEPGIENARLIIENALEEGRHALTAMESKTLLTAFDIPVVRTLEARTVNEALVLAESLGYPVAMKISSPDIKHKAAIGGVRLNIETPQAVRAAFNDLTIATHNAQPGARISGVTIERMHTTPHGRELLVGIATDPVFGPVVTFGTGGSLVELIRDRSIGLPPLNEVIAKDVIHRARAGRLLEAHEDHPAADTSLLAHILLRLSDMICKLPHIKELDINPLVIDDTSALALDARVIIAPPPSGADRYPHMAISPYPMHLVSQALLKDGREITIRPIRPEDAEIEKDFVQRLSAEAKYFRFMESLRELSTSMLIRFTQIDYDREMALIATHTLNGVEQQIGVARYVTLPDGESCEFAIAISDEMHGLGLGSTLMRRLMEVASAQGLRTMQGDVLAVNPKMLAMMRHLGFSVRPSRDDYNVRIVEKSLSA
jgi:acetyltransferase